MRFGFCTSMVATRSDMSGLEFVPMLHELGYDYIELPLAQLMTLSKLDFDETKTTLARLGIRCECCNNFFPKSFRLTGPGIDLGAIETYIKDSLVHAAYLGADTVVFGSGPAKAVPAFFPKETAYTQLLTLLEMMDNIAKPMGMTIVLEPLFKQECNIINTYEEAYRLSSNAQTGQVYGLVDYFHMVQEEESPCIITKDSTFLRHIHISCPQDAHGGIRVAPSAEDGWDYAPLVSAVSQAGYDGRISVEAYMNDVRYEAGNALFFLRSVF